MVLAHRQAQCRILNQIYFRFLISPITIRLDYVFNASPHSAAYASVNWVIIGLDEGFSIRILKSRSGFGLVK